MVCECTVGLVWGCVMCVGAKKEKAWEVGISLVVWERDMRGRRAGKKRGMRAGNVLGMWAGNGSWEWELGMGAGWEIGMSPATDLGLVCL